MFISDCLIVAETSAPLAGDATAAGALGLADALAARGLNVSLLTQADPAVAGAQSGLARRLRLVSASIGGSPIEVPLFEGRPTASAAHLFALGLPPKTRGQTAALLASAAASLARDGLFRPKLVIGWGETAAGALGALPDVTSLFVLPEGRVGDLLPEDEIHALGDNDELGIGGSLLARGLMAAEAIVVPSLYAERLLEAHPQFKVRPSDQPVAVVKMGCDEAPYDPQTDPALAAVYGPESPSGKIACRQALARRLSLSTGPRTLLLAVPALDGHSDGATVAAALGELVGLDVAAVVDPGADRALGERVKVLAIENPGKIALFSADGAGGIRTLLAAADAVVCAELDDRTGRSAGLALRYGAMPIAPQAGAYADLLVDFDPDSFTGTAILYPPGDRFCLGGAIRRAYSLRAGTSNERLVPVLMRTAPRWADTAELISHLAEPDLGETPPHVGDHVGAPVGDPAGELNASVEAP